MPRLGQESDIEIEALRKNAGAGVLRQGESKCVEARMRTGGRCGTFAALLRQEPRNREARWGSFSLRFGVGTGDRACDREVLRPYPETCG